MFETLDVAPPDAILGLTEAFNQDSRPHKINLTAGVYKDAAGQTPLLECVTEAERRLVAEQAQKGYLPIDGLPRFARHVRQLCLGPDHEALQAQRGVTLQTPGGTAALRVAADFIQRKFPQSRIWCSQPTWANHPAVFQAAGLTVQHYPYLDAAGTRFDFDAMRAAVGEIPAGDVICLHACCHNPTGVDPTAEQWAQIAELTSRQGLLPLVDFAYQGFGNGLQEDARGLQEICRAHRELLLCSSFSKNFSLYAERVGALTILADTTAAANAALSHAKRCVRANYSNPPKHGAAIVSTILSDQQLRDQWERELAGMRDRINALRERFVQTMKEKMPQRDFSFITRQRGMFSFSGLTPLQVDELRNEHSIYIVGSGRMNVAGMNENTMDRLGTAIAEVLGK